MFYGQTLTEEHYRATVRADLEREEHPTVKKLRLQRERIIREQEQARYESASQLEINTLRKAIKALGHDPEA